MFYTFVYRLIISYFYTNKYAHFFCMFSNSRCVYISEYVSLNYYEFSETEESQKF